MGQIAVNQVLMMYLEDCRFRRIARIMSKIYRYQITTNWIKDFVREYKTIKDVF